jgi:hypothetical protein
MASFLTAEPGFVALMDLPRQLKVAIRQKDVLATFLRLKFQSRQGSLMSPVKRYGIKIRRHHCEDYCSGDGGS